MVTVEIVPAEPRHAEAIRPHLRAADVAEVEASGLTVAQALTRGVTQSSIACAAYLDGELAALFGVAPASLLGGVGVPWLLGTPRLERYRFTFLRESRRRLPALFGTHYRRLVNLVDDRHGESKRYLAALGFRLDEPVPFGPRGVPFRRFELARAA